MPGNPGEAIVVLVFGGLMALIAVYLVSVWRLQDYMRREHPELWKELGSPDVVFNNTLTNTPKFLAFLRQSASVSINDDVLESKVRTCNRLRGAAAIVFCLISLAAVGLAIFFTAAWWGSIMTLVAPVAFMASP